MNEAVVYPPGAIGALVRMGKIDLRSPRLADLMGLLPADFGAFFSSPTRRLDQRGWPIVRDAQLAVLCLDRRGLPEALAPVVGPLRRFRDGEALSFAEVRSRTRAARALDYGIAALDAPLRAKMAEVGAAFEPDDPWRDLVVTDARAMKTLVWAYVSLESALEGWLAYHAHRRLDSIAATAAATVATLVAEDAPDVYAAMVEDAIRLATIGA